MGDVMSVVWLFLDRIIVGNVIALTREIIVAVGKVFSGWVLPDSTSEIALLFLG